MNSKANKFLMGLGFGFFIMFNINISSVASDKSLISLGGMCFCMLFAIWCEIKEK